MSKISIFFGLLLVTLGLGFYVITGSESNTALIPVIPGFVIGICGLVALIPKYRKHAAHVAALIGLLGGLAGIGNFVRTMNKEDTPLMAKVETFLLIVVCFAYVVLCVKSFISARKALKAEEAAAPKSVPVPVPNPPQVEDSSRDEHS